MESYGFEEIRGSVRSIDESLRRMREHISQIQEIQDLRAELARERSYREFVERMLGYSISTVADYIMSEDNPREIIAGQIFRLAEKLQEYRFGRFVDTTPGTNREAFLRESMELLNEKKHKEAYFALGISHYYGIGVDADHPKSFQIFKNLYDGGYSETRSWLARCLFFGIGVEENKEEAIQLFRRDAKEGKPEAQRMLGLCLHDRGDDASIAEAARYFKMAADQMDTDSQCLYAQCLNNGDGIDVNKGEALAYIQMAADHGNSDGQQCYHTCLLTGCGVQRDLSEALRYLKMAIGRGNMRALANLGLLLFLDDDQIWRVFPPEYLAAAANQGHFFCMFLYAALLCDPPYWPSKVLKQFLSGTDVQEKKVMAARYWRMCADTKDPVSQIMYGICLYDGIGVPVNLSEAARYFKLAADQGNHEAQCLYGLCLFVGDGVDVNQAEADRYFTAAMDQGSKLGKRLHEQCSSNTLRLSSGDVLREGKISFQGRNQPNSDISTFWDFGKSLLEPFDTLFDQVGYRKMAPDRWSWLTASSTKKKVERNTYQNGGSKGCQVA